MATLDLAVGEVEDVAEDSTNRRAYRVQDTKRLVLVFALGRGHDQNLRASTRRRSRRPGCAAIAGASACTRQTAARISQQEKAAYAPRIGPSLKIIDSD
jgi:hypothetical protein